MRGFTASITGRAGGGVGSVVTSVLHLRDSRRLRWAAGLFRGEVRKSYISVSK